MVGRSRGASAPFALPTFLFLLAILLAPLAFLNTVNAQDEQKPLSENLGTGEFYDGGPWCGNAYTYEAVQVIGIDLGTTYS